MNPNPFSARNVLILPVIYPPLLSVPQGLQVLSAGAVTWNDEQSRKNFDAVMRYVVPGEPERSRLLMHPLAEEAGGDDFHGGGRQFASKDTPEWRTIAAWIRGERLK